MSAFICSLRRYTAASTARFRFSSYTFLLGSHSSAPPPPPPSSSRCHHQITAGPLLMCPGTVVQDKVTGVETIYDQFYDPQTGVFKSKERKLESVPNAAKICASSRGWLGLMDTTRDCSLYLANSLLFSGSGEGGDRVLSGEQSSVFKLPSIETLRGFTKGDHHNKDYVVTSKYGKGIMKQREYSGEDLMREFMKGIILSADPNEEHCTAMLMFGETIAFCKPGVDNEWIEHHQFSSGGDDEPFDYSDWTWKPFHPVYLPSDKRFYNLFEGPRSLEGKPALQNPWYNPLDDCGFESWDVTRARQQGLGNQVEEPYLIRHQKHKCSFIQRDCLPSLVANEQSGDLLMPEEYGEYGLVYRLHIDEGQLKRAISIDDVALFTGPYECFSLSVKDFPQLRPNSVYYIHNLFERSGIYSMRDKSVTPLEWPFKNSYSLEKPVFWISPPRPKVST